MSNTHPNVDFESKFNYLNYNIPVWLLNIGCVYIITTLFYFITNKISDDPVLKILEPFPKLKEHYNTSAQYTNRNLLLGMCIGISVIAFFKPFGKFF